MRDDDYGLRPGEKAIALPQPNDAGLIFIGRVRTPWTHRSQCPHNPAESDAVCTVELDPRFTDALTSVETCSHLILLYWLDKARRDLVLQRPKHDDRVHGTFALRSPMRPNPIGLAVVDLIEVKGATLEIRHIDCLDGTPLLDIKPYFARADARPEASVGWHKERANPLPPRG